VSRFEAAQYADFALCLNLAITEIPIPRRIQRVRARLGIGMGSDFPEADRLLSQVSPTVKQSRQKITELESRCNNQ